MIFFLHRIIFRYGSNFNRSISSFKLPENYYFCIKKPLDIPEIRERMHNGIYDDNILLFERDILLMFNNALTMYKRDVNIHIHARYMINYAMELLTVRFPLINCFIHIVSF